MQSLCAQPLTTLPTQTVERQVVSAPIVIGNQASPQQVTVARPDYAVNKQRLQETSILQTRGSELTPELQAIQKQVQYVLQQPADLPAMEQLSTQPELLAAYVERQLYTMHGERSDIRALIRMFVLTLGEKAIDPLLSWGKQFEDRADVVRSIIIAMEYLPENSRLRQFVNTQLDNERQSPDVIRSALIFHIARPDETSKPWAIQFRSPGVSNQYRYLGLYLAAEVFGDQRLFAWIMELLQQQPPEYQRYYLHLALARVVGNAQYQQLAQRLPLASTVRDSVQRQLRFMEADDAQRLSLVSAMLASAFHEERRQALAYLIASRNSERLSELLNGPMAAQVYRKAQYAGIDLRSEQQLKASPRAVQNMPGIGLWRYLLLAVLVVVLIAAMARIKRRGTGHVSPVWL